MNRANAMVLVAALLPYISIGLVKSRGKMDNHAPRRDVEALTGWRQRADWTHRNHFTDTS